MYCKGYNSDNISATLFTAMYRHLAVSDDKLFVLPKLFVQLSRHQCPLLLAGESEGSCLESRW